MSLGLFRHWLIILVVYLAMNYPTNDENNISIPPHYPNGELHVGGSWSVCWNWVEMVKWMKLLPADTGSTCAEDNNIVSTKISG